ncbi:MAG: phytanoyl-CoA dioxygenase family protein [bacterium]|nr:phytanoyl-CoA dioxygenase family protein [bacterium]
MSGPAGVPLTDAFPRAEGDLAEYRLSADEVAAFHASGFLFPRPLLTPAQVTELRARLGSIGERLIELRDRLYEVESAWLERPNEVVLHFLGAWLVDDWFHDLIFHPGVTVPLAQLLGTDRLRFWHDQTFWKPAHHPGVVPWHQDYSYWTRTEPANHITMFISLDDMDASNGGLQYVPESHRWGLLPRLSFGGAADQALEHLTPEQRAQFEPKQVELHAGQAAIHHSHLIHGSLGNPSDRPRRAIVLNFMGPETRCADDSEPLLRGTPAIARGALVDGAYHPIVWRSKPRG